MAVATCSYLWEGRLTAERLAAGWLLEGIATVTYIWEVGC